MCQYKVASYWQPLKLALLQKMRDMLALRWHKKIYGLKAILVGMGLGRIFSAQGQFGLISFGPAQGLGRFWNLTFGPGLGLDFLALGWAGPWAR